MVDVVEAEPGLWVIAVTGDVAFPIARTAVRDALQRLQAAGVRRIVIDVLAAEQLGVPNVAARLETVREWASVSEPGLALAFVGPDAILDQERVGLVHAHGLGMNVAVFGDRASALHWLAGQKPLPH